LVIVLVLAHIWACELVPGLWERCHNLLLEEVVVVDLLQLSREQDLFPLVLEFRQVLRDVGAFSDLDATEDANVISMNKITSRLVDRLEIIPHLVCIGTSASVNLLRGSNVLVNQHPCIGIIELPIVHAYRIEAGVRACNAALDVALGIGVAKEHVYGFSQPVQFFCFLSSVLSIRDIATRSATLRCKMVGRIGAGTGPGDGEGVEIGVHMSFPRCERRGCVGRGATGDGFGVRLFQYRSSSPSGRYVPGHTISSDSIVG